MKLYIHEPKTLPPYYYERDATDAEILAHPAVAALLAEVEALRLRVAEVEGERNRLAFDLDQERAERERLVGAVVHAESAADEAVGRMQQVVYDALTGRARARFGAEAAGMIDGGGSDGDEYDFTRSEVRIALGLYEDALDSAQQERDTALAEVARLRAALAATAAAATCGRVYHHPHAQEDRVCRLPSGHVPQEYGCPGDDLEAAEPEEGK